MTAVKKIAAWEEQLSKGLSADWEVHCRESVGSTMDEARAVFKHGISAKKLIVLSRIQRQGRGRQGRSWYSAPGAFLATFAFPIQEDAAKLSGLSLAIGVIVAELCEEWGASLCLKWPNDIFSDKEAKLGGILIESIPKKAVLIGIGLNLRELPELPPKVKTEVSSLEKLTGALVEPAEFGLRLAQELEKGIEIFLSQGFTPFRRRWEKRALWGGELVTVELGDEEISGKLLSVSNTGALLIEQKNATREVVAGDVVRFRRKAAAA